MKIIIIYLRFAQAFVNNCTNKSEKKIKFIIKILFYKSQVCIFIEVNY